MSNLPETKIEYEAVTYLPVSMDKHCLFNTSTGVVVKFFNDKNNRIVIINDDNTSQVFTASQLSELSKCYMFAKIYKLTDTYNTVTQYLNDVIKSDFPELINISSKELFNNTLQEFNRFLTDCTFNLNSDLTNYSSINFAISAEGYFLILNFHNDENKLVRQEIISTENITVTYCKKIIKYVHTKFNVTDNVLYYLLNNVN